MKKIMKVLKEECFNGKKNVVENNEGLFHRAQKVLDIIENEMWDFENELKMDPHNKILIITHRSML